MFRVFGAFSVYCLRSQRTYLNKFKIFYFVADYFPRRMSQKSILTFFKKSDQESKSSSNKVIVPVTPPKKATKRKRSEKSVGNSGKKRTAAKVKGASTLNAQPNSVSKNDSNSKNVSKSSTLANGKEEKTESAESSGSENNNTSVSESPLKAATKRKRAKKSIENEEEGESNTAENKVDSKLSSTKRAAVKDSLKHDSDPKDNPKDSSKHNSDPKDVPKESSKHDSEPKNVCKSVNGIEEKMDYTESSSSKMNAVVDDFSPVKKSKRKKVKKVLESEEEDCSDANHEEIETKNSVSETVTQPTAAPKIKNEAESSSNYASTSSKDTSASNHIPKRKTARKQIKSAQTEKKSLPLKIKEEPKHVESASEVESSISSSTEDTDKTKSNSDCKQIKSVKTEKKSSPPKIKEEPRDVESTSEIESSISSSTEETDKTKSNSEGEMDNSSVTSKKKEDKKSIHPFFKTGKKSSEDKNQSSSSRLETEKKPSDDKGKSSSSKNKIACSSVQGTVYDPSKTHYHPIDDACWKHKEKVPYLALAKTLELIENTSARLKIVEILSNFFRSVIVLSPDDLLFSVYLCLNRLAPEYEGIELGIGETLLMKAVAQATGRTLDKIKAEVAVKGDLGSVAESSRGNQKVMFAPPKLTVASVFSKFKEIAQMSGNSAMAKKTDKIQVLFVACRDCEAKYIIRSLSGKLRIGLAEQSVLAALARAATLTPPGQSYPPEIIDASSGKSAEKFKEKVDSKILILKTVYCECPNYDIIMPVLLKEGLDALPNHCQLCPGRPLKPMLAHPTSSVEEVLKRFDNNEFTCEFKYDGERAQIHMTDKGEITIYSRNQENNTSKYPDVLTRISKVIKDNIKSFILDTEAVAWDKESKQILPFQVLSTRKKKDAVESDIVVHVCIMAFDLLYLNGESLVKKPLKERRTLLHESFNEIESEFMFVTFKDGNSAETMQEFLDESVQGNCEGLMIKALETDASYEIAKRSHNWLKLKKDYLNGVGDTLDLVVIGGYFGKGKRTGTYGGFLLACYDDDNEEFQSICKLGTGFKEDELEAHTKFFKQYIIKEPKSYYRFDKSLEPDQWFEPVQVWEIKCADLSISPVHKAAVGIIDPVKGISLRFPRFIKIREDKKAEDANVSSQIAKMYESQSQIQNIKKNSTAEEDYY